MNNGSCLCGDITWMVNGDFTMLINCHCSICRSVHGSAYGAFIVCPVEGFSWIAGQDKIRSYSSSENGHRPFCPRCGSSVATVTEKLASMPAGNLDGNISRSLDSHIFVAHKACWFEITDDAPQFDEFSPHYRGIPVASRTPVPVMAGAVGGGCSCGAVQYEFDGPAESMTHCHCEACRKSRSAPFASNVFVAEQHFRWLCGQENLCSFKDSNLVHLPVAFCCLCSSCLPARLPGAGDVMIPAGGIDQDPGITPQAHLRVARKASWVEISDDLPQFDDDGVHGSTSGPTADSA